jgi:serine/threonine protein kinase
VNETFGLKQGEILNERFELKENLGGRRTNRVWLAADIETGDEVVLKWPEVELDNPLSEGTVLKKIKREGGHENIVNLRDTFEIELDEHTRTVQVLVKDYVEGPTLQEYVLENDNDVGDELAHKIGVQLADALSKCHKEDFILREFSPSDIILTGRNKPIFVDFGSAFHLFEEGKPAEPAVVKSQFAAPEVQQPGSRIDAHSDIYTLGKILFYSLTGGSVPDNHSLDPNEYGIDINEGLSFVISEATKEDRGDRIPTGAAMAKKLKLYKNKSGLDI